MLDPSTMRRKRLIVCLGPTSATKPVNLLGTTRTLHPHLLGEDTRSTSAGVCVSLPGQNGQEGSNALPDLNRGRMRRSPWSAPQLVIQREIQLKHIDSGFAEQTELTRPGVLPNQTADLIFGCRCWWPMECPA